MGDAHAVLGVPTNAGDADIKKAYKALCLKYHPDKNDGDEEAANRFKEIQSAYLQLMSNSTGGDNASRAAACQEAVGNFHTLLTPG